MTLPQRTDKKFTYDDYLIWPDGERWEIIDGEAYNMSPAPTVRHQDIVKKLSIIISTHPEKKAECFVGIAPMDVVLSDYDIVQPDILIVCDEKKITEANIRGAPDLVIEVLSPNTAMKDKREKKALYEKYGVREYILVDPVAKYIERFLLGKDGFYDKGKIFGGDETVSLISPGNIKIRLSEVFS